MKERREIGKSPCRLATAAVRACDLIGPCTAGSKYRGYRRTGPEPWLHPRLGDSRGTAMIVFW